MDKFDESNEYEVDIVCKILNANKHGVSRIDGKIIFEISSFEICHLFSHIFSFVYIKEMADYTGMYVSNKTFVKIESYNKKEFQNFLREQKLKRILC